MVETRVSTTVLNLPTGLEVDLQSELPEAPLIVRTIVVADAALGSRDRQRHPWANVGNVIEPSLDEEIVVVQQIESLCAKLNVDLFMDGQDLADSGIEGIGRASCRESADDMGEGL